MIRQKIGWWLMGVAWPREDKFRSIRLYRLGCDLYNWGLK